MYLEEFNRLYKIPVNEPFRYVSLQTAIKDICGEEGFNNYFHGVFTMDDFIALLIVCVDSSLMQSAVRTAYADVIDT